MPSFRMVSQVAKVTLSLNSQKKYSNLGCHNLYTHTKVLLHFEKPSEQPVTHSNQTGAVVSPPKAFWTLRIVRNNNLDFSYASTSCYEACFTSRTTDTWSLLKFLALDRDRLVHNPRTDVEVNRSHDMIHLCSQAHDNQILTVF